MASPKDEIRARGRKSNAAKAKLHAANDALQTTLNFSPGWARVASSESSTGTLIINQTLNFYPPPNRVVPNNAAPTTTQPDSQPRTTCHCGATSDQTHISGHKRTRKDAAIDTSIDEESEGDDSEYESDSNDSERDPHSDELSVADSDSSVQFVSTSKPSTSVEMPGAVISAADTPDDEKIRTVSSPISKGGYRVYTKKEKLHALKVYEETPKLENGKPNLESVVRKLKSERPFANIKRANIYAFLKWRDKTRESRGRKVNPDFERQVLNNLIFTVLRDVPGPTPMHPMEERLEACANVAYSYTTIKEAGRLAKASTNWPEAVARIQLSDKWVTGFLRRNTLRRRRITSLTKTTLPLKDIQDHMRHIQEVITSGSFRLEDIVNADETGIFFGARPKWQYVPPETERATVPDGREKERFTALMWGTAAGEMGPPFLIIKNSTGGADQSKSTVLDDKHLGKHTGFRDSDGWELRTWSKTMTLKVKNKMETNTYSRNYLFNAATCMVVTANPTAWMDSVTMSMWAEVQLSPWAELKKRRILLVMDNCGPHSVPAVEATFSAAGITVEKLPPNMTAQLQVMDLVVNGPLKAAIRSERCKQLFHLFQSWKERCQSLLDAGEKLLPNFDPPRVSQVDGMITLIECWKGRMRSPTFVDGLKRAFVHVGLAPEGDPPMYRNYTGRISYLPRSFQNADAPTDTEFKLGDVAAEVEMQAPPLVDYADMPPLEDI